MVNRAFGTRYNRKRIQRLMQLAGLTVPRSQRRIRGRAHTGRIRRDHSNERWCSDSLTVVCWHGDLVEIAFVLDCADRECLATVAVVGALTGADIRRLLSAACQPRLQGQRPTGPLELLSDNERMYTALETVIRAEHLGLTPITTPAYRPQSNGMSEAFVQTLRRDYLDGADLRSATRVFVQLGGWPSNMSPSSVSLTGDFSSIRRLYWPDIESKPSGRRPRYPFPKGRGWSTPGTST
jgi:putative transposase